MSTADKLLVVAETRQNIRTAIQEMGVDVPAGTLFVEYPNYIRSIQAGEFQIAPTVTSTQVEKTGPRTFRLAFTSARADTYAFQWMLDGVNIEGAVSQNYTAPPAMAGSLSAAVTVSNNVGQASATSSGFAIIAAPVVSSVTISPSSAAMGTTYTASVSASAGAAVSYQWQVNGSDVQGATAATYKPVVATANLRVKATATTAWGSHTVVSNAAVVTQVEIPNITNVGSVSGSNLVGGTLSVSGFTYTGAEPITIAYQWLLNGQEINGAVSATYTTNAAGTYSRQVTLSNAGGVAVGVTNGYVVSQPTSNWAVGIWDDSGTWDDTATWNDGA